MKEWICKEEPLIRSDGASVGVGFRRMVELVRCKDCKWAEVSDNEHTWCDHVDHEFCHNNDWFCADGERNDSNNSSSSESPNS